jgi:hypothetical protein
MMVDRGLVHSSALILVRDSSTFLTLIWHCFAHITVPILDTLQENLLVNVDNPIDTKRLKD